jgi:glycosyltransferase involved in cell wall biosynthesis
LPNQVSIITRKPCVTDIGVIALVDDRWGTFWETRHFVLTRLSEYFPVVWCDPPYTRRNLWAKPVASGFGQDSSLFPGLSVYHPERWYPNIGRPRFLNHWMGKKRLNNAHNLLVSQGCRKIIIYLWRPEFHAALDLINYDLSCYHIDDDYTFGNSCRLLLETERKIASRVDQVFITSPGLLAEKGHLNPNTLFVPNGVDYRAFATPCAEPEDLLPIPHPRIGYVGVIKHQLNLSLLLDLARRNRDLSFVLVGPQRLHEEVTRLIFELSRLTNVYFLGPRPLAALPAYQQHMDVSLLCYKVNSYTQDVYPLKLHQYLASGTPIIGSRIRSLEDFVSVIDLAETSDEWTFCIKNALSPGNDSPGKAEKRRSLAKQHDWNRLVEEIAYTLCLRLGSPYVERIKGMVKKPRKEQAL